MHGSDSTTSSSSYAHRHTGHRPSLSLSPSLEQQIDCLADVGAVVGNDDGVIWTMQNGYAMPARPGAIAQLSERLAAS